MKQVYISLVYFNNEKDTLACLRSLEKIHAKEMSLHVVIIDNASEKPLNIQEHAYTNFSLILLRNDTNKGFSGGHNTAIAYARSQAADFVLILNNDTIVHPHLLSELLKGFEQREDIGITVPKIYFAKGEEYHKDRYAKKDQGKVIWYAGGIMQWESITGVHKGVDMVDAGQFDQQEETEFASGCCMLVKQEVFETIGVFDERYFLYYEDSDFSMRVKQNGWHIWYIPNAVLWHKNASATGGVGSSLQDYYISRNRLLFGMTYASFRMKLHLLRESVSLLLKGRRAQKKGIRDFFYRHFGKEE